MNRIYTGIGSRQTPENVCSVFTNIGQQLSKKGFILRSGGADGADRAFEIGVDKHNKKRKEIYLPWKGFNGNNSQLYDVDENAMKIAKHFHPAWNKLSQGAKKLHSRNVYQVLGKDLKSPSDFVVCFTPETGGTQQALRIAKYYSIPIFNFFYEEDVEDFCELLKQIPYKL